MTFFKRFFSILCLGISGFMGLGFLWVVYAYFFDGITPANRLEVCEKMIASGRYVNAENPIAQCLVETASGAGTDDVLSIFSAVLFMLAIVFYVIGRVLTKKP
ncbi:MAG: hypothetical protein ACNYPF_04245 [Candidatus Puniceispirillales bacterium WSBS_2018_MAG_OTU23]